MSEFIILGFCACLVGAVIGVFIGMKISEEVDEMEDDEEEPKEYLEKDRIISCYGCGCLIYKGYGKQVSVVNSFGGFEHFCGRCKPEYDEIEYGRGEPRYYKNNRVEIKK